MHLACLTVYVELGDSLIHFVDLEAFDQSHPHRLRYLSRLPDWTKEEK